MARQFHPWRQNAADSYDDECPATPSDDVHRTPSGHSLVAMHKGSRLGPDAPSSRGRKGKQRSGHEQSSEDCTLNTMTIAKRDFLLARSGCRSPLETQRVISTPQRPLSTSIATSVSSECGKRSLQWIIPSQSAVPTSGHSRHDSDNALAVPTGDAHIAPDNMLGLYLPEGSPRHHTQTGSFFTFTPHDDTGHGAGTSTSASRRATANFPGDEQGDEAGSFSAQRAQPNSMCSVRRSVQVEGGSGGTDARQSQHKYLHRRSATEVNTDPVQPDSTAQLHPSILHCSLAGTDNTVHASSTSQQRCDSNPFPAPVLRANTVSMSCHRRACSASTTYFSTGPARPRPNPQSSFMPAGMPP